MHRTSGTTGVPMKILDTAADWHWWSQTWQHVLDAASVEQSDRAFLAFSFGPFVGFWSAHQAIADRGALVIPGGGLSSIARLDFMRTSAANIVCCTPSYALHLAAVAEENEFDLAGLQVDRLIVAGEAGGSIPSVRAQIERAWAAEVIDHSGATEIGPWGFGWRDRIGLHIIETSFVAELLPIDAVDGEADTDLRELVLTSIGRIGAPVIRYRTGDVVRAGSLESGQCGFLWLPEGVVGRADNMVTIRGVNVFPSSVDRIVREILPMAEYRVTVFRQGHLDQMAIEVEATADGIARLKKHFESRLGLRIPVEAVQDGSLPRSEGKSRRWIDNR
jgi:phenylacetate-CoA ligase